MPVGSTVQQVGNAAEASINAVQIGPNKVKLSIITTADIDIDRRVKTQNQLKRRAKPWDERRTATIGNKMRAKLPGVNVYDKELEYQAEGSPRVLLRLERVIGTDKVRINNSRYMSTLSKKIEEDERKQWRRRVTKRQIFERMRYRQLIIDGILEPDESMGIDEIQIRAHPIFRVNRLMKKLNQFQINVNEKGKLPQIVPIEPFEDLKKTGLLFGLHSDHYLKSSKFKAYSGSIMQNLFIASQSQQASENLMFKLNRDTEEYEKEEQNEDGDVQNDSEETSKTGIGIRGKVIEETEALAKLLRTESLTKALKFMELDEERLKQQWDRPHKKLVQNIYDPENEDALGIYDSSHKLLGTYKREVMKSEDFCNKVHRRLFH